MLVSALGISPAVTLCLLELASIFVPPRHGTNCHMAHFAAIAATVPDRVPGLDRNGRGNFPKGQHKLNLISFGYGRPKKVTCSCSYDPVVSRHFSEALRPFLPGVLVPTFNLYHDITRPGAPGQTPSRRRSRGRHRHPLRAVFLKPFLAELSIRYGSEYPAQALNTRTTPISALSHSAHLSTSSARDVSTPDSFLPTWAPHPHSIIPCVLTHHWSTNTRTGDDSFWIAGLGGSEKATCGDGWGCRFMDAHRFDETFEASGDGTQRGGATRPLDVVFVGANLTNLASAVALCTAFEGIRVKVGS